MVVEMADHHTSRSSDRAPQPLGDEADLYRQFSRILVGTIAQRVNTSRDVVEDACAFAWMQFVRRQPDRDRGWRGWLIKVAEHKAWSLHREMVADTGFRIRDEDGERLAPEPPDRIDRTEQYLDARDALEALAQVPERRRRAKALHVLGYTYDEIGPMLGVRRVRASHLIREANEAVREIYERSHDETAPRSPRAARLQELEAKPPEWLRALIGRPRKDRAERLLAWRAAALAIDDFRRDHLEPGQELLVDRPSDPRAERAYELARRTVERVRAIDERGIER